MKIQTIKELKDIIKNLDDDFKLDIQIMKRIPEKQLLKSLYPYPWQRIDARLEFHDIGYSDKEVCFGIYEDK